MADILVSPANAIKGNTFAAHLQTICAGPLPAYPIGQLKCRNILLPHMIGGEIYFAMVGMIGQALRMRGAQCTALMCDAFMPACTLRKIDHYESACTRWCHKNAQPFADAMQLPYKWYSQYISQDERGKCEAIAKSMPPDELFDFEYMDVPLGNHVNLSVCSFFKVGKADLDDPNHLIKAREFARTAMYLTIVGHRAIDSLRIDKLVMEDGKKVDWGVIRSVAAKKSIPVDCIRAALRGYSIRFEHDRPPETMLLMPEWDVWKDIPLTRGQENKLDAYLSRREKVPFEYRNDQWQAHTTEDDRVRQLIDLPAEISGKVFAMFPNVSFDAGLTQTKTAFSSANQWVAETIRMLRDRPEHHLIIKVHPAEHHRQAQDPLIPYIQSRFSTIPKNVHLVPPDTDITAQAVVRQADWTLAYTSTISVEAAALGRPVMLVGGGWNSGRGFTVDISSPDEYVESIDAICTGRRCYKHPHELARRYAYALFFRSNIPINHYEVLDLGVTSLKIKSLHDLAPGKDASMDVICRGILNDELLESPE